MLEVVRRDTGMSSAVGGLLTTIPFVCLGAFAFASAPLLRRFDTRRLVGVCLAGLGVATVVRAAAPSAATLLVATVPVGLCIAVIGSVLPSIVKRRFPDRGGAMTGVYVAAQGVGAAVVSFAAVPLSGAIGGWRVLFALFALPVLVALPVWARIRLGPAQRGLAGKIALGRPDGLIVLLALVFGLQSICFSSVIAFLPALFRDAGYGEALAGATTGVISVVALPAALLVPRFSDDFDRRWSVAGAGALMTAAMAGLALAPTTAPVLWLVLFALGNGAIFPLALTLPLDLARDEAETVRLSAWTVGVGSLIASTGPVLTGALRDATGGFTVPMTALAMLAAVPAVLALAGLGPLRPGDRGRGTRR